MITALLIIIAAICKAVADTLDDHFSISVFRTKNPLVWDANYSTVKKFWFTNYKPDPWHLCNSLMIVCFGLAIVLNDIKAAWWFQLIGIGVLFNLVFEVFYSHFLISKRYRK